MIVFPHVSLASDNFESRLQQNNKYIASRWRLLNYQVDTFFSNKKYDFENNESNFSMHGLAYKKEGSDWENEFNFKAKIHLPATTKKLKLVIEQDQDDLKKAMSDEFVKSDSDDQTKVSKKSSERYSAALSYLLNNTEDFNASFKFGLRIDMPLNPSLKFNINKLITFTYFSIELSQDFILYRQEGFSEISSANISRSWSKKLRTDFINTVAWSNETSIFLLRNNFLTFYKLDEKRTLTHSIAATAKFRPVFYYDSYDSSLSLRQNLSNELLFATLSIGAEFLKEENFNMRKFVQLKLDLYFN